jgi:hypothetical protein
LQPLDQFSVSHACLLRNGIIVASAHGRFKKSASIVVPAGSVGDA